jgi:hypothetical protein
MVAPLEQVRANAPVIQPAEREAANVLVGDIGGDTVEPSRPLGLGRIRQLSPLWRGAVSRHKGSQSLGAWRFPVRHR